MQLFDRVKSRVYVSGTDNATHVSALEGYRGLNNLPDGAIFPYVIVGGSQWEIGRGIWLAGSSTLQRHTVHSNSNNTASKIDFTSGTKLCILAVTSAYMTESLGSFQTQVDDAVDALDSAMTAFQAAASTALSDLANEIASLESNITNIVNSQIASIIDSKITQALQNSGFSTQLADTLRKSNNLSDLSNITTAKTNLGINNVNNTSDANKPISTATQQALNAKQGTIVGAASTITSSNLTASRALVSSSGGKVEVSAVTATELGYLDGVTGAIQTQINGKAASSHAHTTASITGLDTALNARPLQTTPLNVSLIAANTAAVAGTAYYLNSTGTITLSLPSAPAAGNVVRVINHTSQTHVISRNGNNIMRLAENLIIDKKNAAFDLVWTGNATIGWVIS